MEIVKYILIGIPALMAILSGLMKLTGNKKVVEPLTKVGVGKFITVFGVAEIVFALLFIYPPTRNLGFIFLVCYFSGALATDLSHKTPVFPPIMLLSILFIAQYVNTPSFFF
jgi:DoxX-like family